MKLIGVDVGGTFTDVVLFDSETGETAVHKVPTTPEDPSRGVMRGVLELCRSVAIDPGAITHVYHGTTIATNAVLEYKGARTGMITTKGYRDIIHSAGISGRCTIRSCRRFPGSITRWCGAPSARWRLSGWCRRAARCAPRLMKRMCAKPRGS